MNKMYIIQWKSKVNGRVGKGTKLFDREEAQRLVNELNREYPEIEHEFVNSDPQGEAKPTHPDRIPAVSVE